MDERILHDPHHNCDRCGFKKRSSELRRQLGLWVCRSCWDNPENRQRERVISKVLSDGKNELGTWLDNRFDEDESDRVDII